MKFLPQTWEEKILNVFTPENELEYASHQSPNIKIQYTILTKGGEFKHFKLSFMKVKVFVCWN